MEKVSGSVVAHNILATQTIHLRDHPVSSPHSAFDHCANMHNDPRRRFAHLINAHFPLRLIHRYDPPHVRNLSARFHIERCLR